MEILLAPVLLALAACVFAGTRGIPDRWVRLALRMGGSAVVLAAAVAATMVLSRRPSGAWRTDLLPSIPVLYAAILGELWVAAAIFEALTAGSTSWGVRALQVVVTTASGLLFGLFTVIALVAAMPS